MIGIDTNVLVRLLVKDDAVQAQRAMDFVAERCSPQEPGFVDRVVLCELVWVLSGIYEYGRAEIIGVIEGLLESRDIVLEDNASVRTALAGFKGRNVDFSDALVGAVNVARGCQATARFDRRAGRLDGFVDIG